MRTPTLGPSLPNHIQFILYIDRLILVITSFQEIPALGLSPQSNRQSKTNRRPAESPAPLAPATQRTQGRRRGVLGSLPHPTAPHGRSGTAVMRRARPASGGAPDTAAVSQIPPRYLGYQPGISETAPISQQNPAAFAATTHRTLLLSVAQDTQGARGTQDMATRRAEQRRHTGQGVAQCRRVAAALQIVGVDVVLAVFLAFLPFYDQYCSRAREELHHPRYRPSIPDTEPVSRDTPPVSQIPERYPSCSLPLRPGGSRHQPHNILLLSADHGGRRIEQHG